MPDEKPKPEPGQRRRGRYPKQFKNDSAALVIDQGRTVADVARELGVIEQTLGNWVRQERIDRGLKEGTSTEVREENAQLRREFKHLTMERDLLKNNGLLGERVRAVTKYLWISARKAEGFPVAVACHAAEVTRSSYDDWRDRSQAPTGAELDEAYVVNEIHLVHGQLDDTYGSPSMTAEIRSRGFCVNHKRVERLMATHGLDADDARRRRVRTTISDGAPPPLPDLINRDFSVGAPRKPSCGDITYVRTNGGWRYVASVLDLGSRRLIGLKMANYMRSALLEDALRSALSVTNGSLGGLIFHRLNLVNTWAELSTSSASTSGFARAVGGLPHVTTIRRPSPSGPHSSENSSIATASRHGTRQWPQSLPGSGTTTPAVATAPLVKSHHWTGNYASPPKPSSPQALKPSSPQALKAA